MAVDKIRESHEHNFLPLKIVDYESYIFSEQIEPYLYQKEEHLAYLKRTWRCA